jgi:uncharacterized protein (TIGR02217 family)
MAFVEQTLLSCVALGVSGGPGFLTDVITVRSGHESRNQLWAQARRHWEIGMTARPQSEFEAIQNAFMTVGGRRDGFLFTDPFDSSVSASTGVLIPLHGVDDVGTVGFGYGVETFQIGKLYTTYQRNIYKPNSVVVYRGGVAVVEGVGAGEVDIDNTTGIVTMVADQSRAISSHAVSATHTFTLGSAFSPNLAIGGRIFVTGVTGTAAATLNGLSHAVTGVSTAVITTSTNTAGLTASGGTAFFYPQPTETMKWLGSFDTPVRFDTDQFNATVIDRQGAGGELLIELPSIQLIEIRV